MPGKSKGSRKGSKKASRNDRLKRAEAAGRGAAKKIGQVASGITKATGDAIGHVLPSRTPAGPGMAAEMEQRIREIVREEIAAHHGAEGETAHDETAHDESAHDHATHAEHGPAETSPPETT